MMHVLRMIERRHPQHAGGIARALVAAFGLALMAGGLLLLAR